MHSNEHSNKSGNNRGTGYVTRKELKSHRDYVHLLQQVDNGEMIRVKAGVYAHPDTLGESVPDISRIIPGGILCLYSAWSHHQLSTQIPTSICVAVKRGRKIVLPAYPIITLYRISDAFLNLGLIHEQVCNHLLPVYDLERCVCDALRYRNKIGMETCSEILHQYLRRPKRNLDKLHSYATQLRVNSVLSTYLQITL